MVGSAVGAAPAGRGLRGPDRDAGRGGPSPAGGRGRLDGAQPAPGGSCWRPPPSAASSPTTPRPAEFLYDNLMIEANLIEAAHRCGVEKLLFLGSSCIYPRLAPQPISEDALLTGPLEPTNEWYAVAKIAGIKLCQAYRRQYGCDFISAMPSNLYGPGDNFDLKSSHVLPALMRKAHEAKAAGRAGAGGLGLGLAAAGVPPRGRPRRRPGVPAAALFRREPRQRRDRRGISPSATWRRWSAGSSASRASCASTPPSPTARRASCWTSRAWPGWDGGRRSASPRAWRRPTAPPSTSSPA